MAEMGGTIFFNDRTLFETSAYPSDRWKTRPTEKSPFKSRVPRRTNWKSPHGEFRRKGVPKETTYNQDMLKLIIESMRKENTNMINNEPIRNAQPEFLKVNKLITKFTDLRQSLSFDDNSVDFAKIDSQIPNWMTKTKNLFIDKTVENYDPVKHKDYRTEFSTVFYDGSIGKIFDVNHLPGDPYN